MTTGSPPCASPAAPAAVASVRAPSDLPRVLGPVEAVMEAHGYPRRDILGVRLALEEALANALKHGHKGDRSKTARVRYRVTADEVLAEVEDEGPGFDPGAVADPRAERNLERLGGRGLLLMRHYMTWVHYSGRGNIVILYKCRSGDESR